VEAKEPTPAALLLTPGGVVPDEVGTTVVGVDTDVVEGAVAGFAFTLNGVVKACGPLKKAVL